MFSVVSVHHSVGGVHATITKDALDHTVQGPPVEADPGLAPMVVISDVQTWRPVQACSLEDPSLVLTLGGN